jgi:hypothetical protein
MAPNTLNQSLIEFLQTVSSTKELYRCTCGAIMQYRNTTFFYDGQNWEVQLPVCPACYPAEPVQSYDA